MIPLKETEFDFDAINDQIVGAGVLPVSIDDAGQVRFLLGKERYINHWRGSLKWSGFEGGRKPGENVERTAAREFVEESIGIVSFNGVASTIDVVHERILNGEYFARIVLCILHGDNAERRYHVTYIVQVPYDKEYSGRFIRRRRSFVDLHNNSQQLSKLNEELLRMDVPIENQVYKDTMISAIIRIERDSKHGLRVECISDKGTTFTYHLDWLNEEQCNIYLRWFHTRLAFTVDCDEFARTCHSAISMERNTKNIVTGAKMNEDFIEKQTIQWWNIDELRHVLMNGGYLNTDFFRAYFLPVLQRAIQEIDEFKP